MAVESSRSENRRSSKSKSPGVLHKVAPVLPYVVGGVLLVGYFVWMCIEMSSDAPGGGAVPLSIFGAVLLGILAGGLSMLKSRGDK
jgi:hypothetical protein